MVFKPRSLCSSRFSTKGYGQGLDDEAAKRAKQIAEGSSDGDIRAEIAAGRVGAESIHRFVRSASKGAG